MNPIVNAEISLSPLGAADEAAIVAGFKDKEIYDNTLRIPYPYTPAHFQTYLQIVDNATREQGRPVQWAIRDRTGTAIGGCGFDGLSIGKTHRAELGYWLAKPRWGRGIMTAVVGCVCHYAFAHFGLIKIEGHVFADNHSSAAVLKKCRFIQEGYLRKHYLKDGRYIDAIIYSLFKE